MSLIKLIKGLSGTEKTELLGSETERILRYTFTDKDTDALPKEIVNLAVANSKGAKMIREHKARTQLIESLKIDKIKSLGFENYKDAIKCYKNNFAQFVTDFEIENDFVYEKPADERTNSEYIIPVYGESNGSSAFPHPYQLRLKDELNYLFRTRRHSNILITMPTGAGKTILAMEVIIDLLRSFKVGENKKLQIGWFVEKQELCEQSLQSFQKLWKQKGDRKVICQRYFDKFNELNNSNENRITFATFTLLTSRLAQPEVKKFLQGIDVLVIDEAHASNAYTYKEVLDTYEEYSPQGLRLGLTATPYRNDDDEFQTLRDVFRTYLEIKDENGKELESPIDYLVKGEYLSSVQIQVLNAERGNSNSDYYKQLHTAVKEECLNLISKKENTIIFAQSRSHAIALNIYLKREGIENELIIGNTPPILRKNYLQRFGDSEETLSVLVNHQILSTGIDVPGLNSIMVLSKIESPTLALQVIGRAMRGEKNGGNPSNTLYLTKDNHNRLKEFKLLENIVLNR